MGRGRLHLRRRRDVSADRLFGSRQGPLLADLPAGLLRRVSAPHTVVALELEEGPLFVSYPVGIDAADLREGMRPELRWRGGADRFGEYDLPVFGPPRS